jgi:hypothetical protein
MKVYNVKYTTHYLRLNNGYLGLFHLTHGTTYTLFHEIPHLVSIHNISGSLKMFKVTVEYL